MALLSLILALTGILTVTTDADADGGCFPGNYIVKESSGTQSLWTLSQDGTYQSASSAEVACNFDHIQGAWKKTGLDNCARQSGFIFSSGNGDTGLPPLRIARLDAVMSFTNKCEEVEGTFELRFFGPDDDPLSDPAEFIFSDTFTGRRVTISFAASAKFYGSHCCFTRSMSNRH